jgi:hypothetical protein
MYSTDREQPVRQAQREAADAAFGNIRFEHRRAEWHIAPSCGDRGAQLEADRFKDVLMESGREMRSWTRSGRCHRRSLTKRP